MYGSKEGGVMTTGPRLVGRIGSGVRVDAAGCCPTAGKGKRKSQVSRRAVLMAYTQSLLDRGFVWEVSPSTAQNSFDKLPSDHAVRQPLLLNWKEAREGDA